MRIAHPSRFWLAAALIAMLILVAMPLAAHGQESTPPPPSARLDGLMPIPQTWNDCGPANLTEAMSYFGWRQDQAVAASWLKPNVEDKNVSPWQMAAFVNQQSDLPIRALWRYGGTLDLLKQLIAAGFPVIIESGFDVENLGWMGHYEAIVAYDDTTQTMWHYDTYLYDGSTTGLARSYAEVDQWWRHFNRVFVVVFPLDRQDELRTVLGDYVDPTYAAQAALDAARQEATADPTDKWAWFNAGTSAVKLGKYSDAAIYYDEAFRHDLPWRMLWYQFGPYEAYYDVGRYQDVLSLADTTQATTEYVEETHYWRGMAFAALGQYQDAVAQFNETLSFNRNFTDAATAKSLVESGQFVPPVLPQ